MHSSIKTDQRAVVAGKYMGELRRFCCGTDFLPNNSKVRISILGARIGSETLKDCLAALSQISLPVSGNFNFSLSTARDAIKLKEYEARINDPERKGQDTHNRLRV